MALETYSNAAQTTTSGSINNTSNPVTFSVADASTFPSSGQFRILIDSEIMLVTSRTGNSLTASRAQEGTTIATHTTSATVTHLVTAGAMAKIIGDYNIVDLFSNRPAAGVPGRTFRTMTPAGMLWIDNGTSWDLYCNDFGPFDPNISDFTGWINQTPMGATTDFTNGIHTVNVANDANTVGGTEQLVLRYRTPPSAPYTFTGAFRLRGPMQANVSGGIIIRDSSTGHITAMAVSLNAQSVVLQYRWDDYNSFSGNPQYSQNQYLDSRNLVFFRVVNNGTTWKWYYSGDFITWHEWYEEAVSGAHTASCNQVGFYINYQNRNVSSVAGPASFSPIPPVAIDILHAKVT